MKKTIPNPQKCPRFNWCSVNICPLDLEADLRSKLPEETSCPFTIKKRGRNQKGIRTRIPDHALKFVPESNVRILHRSNQKRWHELHKNYGK